MAAEHGVNKHRKKHGAGHRSERQAEALQPAINSAEAKLNRITRGRVKTLRTGPEGAKEELCCIYAACNKSKTHGNNDRGLRKRS